MVSAEFISIATPILLGMLINFIVYFIFSKIEKTKNKAIKFTWFATVGMIVFSYISAFTSSITWGGFGYFIISIGMFAVALALTIFKNPIWKTSKEHD
ncbi:hypothetical protein QR721_07565 [Aciduricibacillus chroicocephali]|uniref:YesK-like protein n=1 Tax=Aciduricibacillus chroicocephali TaxID=3054939 RepID=A0ABY9KRZ1_9BACI|nr:hypothetical protein QR721_07565 [Bacillaceae bacterium 44XB]